MSEALDGVAKRLKVPITSVALAYAMQKVSKPPHLPQVKISSVLTFLTKAPYVFPILGGRKVSYLKANVEALSLQLTLQDVEEIEKGYDFDTGFPHNFINMAGKAPRGPEDASILASLGFFDYVQGQQPIKPHQGEINVPWKP